MPSHPAPQSLTSNPVIVLFLPVFYIFGACMSLLQFQVMLSLIFRAIVKVKAIPALKAVVPVLASLSDYLTRVFGPAHKFTPQPTHVYLIAIMIAIIVHMERRR